MNSDPEEDLGLAGQGMAPGPALKQRQEAHPAQHSQAQQGTGPALHRDVLQPSQKAHAECWLRRSTRSSSYLVKFSKPVLLQVFWL